MIFLFLAQSRAQSKIAIGPRGRFSDNLSPCSSLSHCFFLGGGRGLNINGRLWSCEGSSEARCSCANNRYVWINPTNWLKNKKYQCIRTYYLVYKEKLVWLIVWPKLKDSKFLECFWCIGVTPALAVWHSRGLEFNEDSNMVYIYLGADDRFRF